MKRLFLLAIALLLVPIVLASTPMNCYQNFTAIRCGEQAEFNSAQYCAGINLTIEDCYNEGGKFTVVFSGVKYFKAPDPVSRITFFFYSRNWAWLGDETDIPLPDNSTVAQVSDNRFIVVSPLGSKKVESVQITIPFCYNQMNSDLEKIYLRTQAGKICRIVTPEEVPSEPAAQSSNPSAPVAAPATQSKADNGWILGVLLVVVVIVAVVFILRKPKARKKKK